MKNRNITITGCLENQRGVFHVGVLLLIIIAFAALYYFRANGVPKISDFTGAQITSKKPTAAGAVFSKEPADSSSYYDDHNLRRKNH